MLLVYFYKYIMSVIKIMNVLVNKISPQKWTLKLEVNLR
jgi:hypothetical protein